MEEEEETSRPKISVETCYSIRTLKSCVCAFVEFRRNLQLYKRSVYKYKEELIYLKNMLYRKRMVVQFLLILKLEDGSLVKFDIG